MTMNEKQIFKIGDRVRATNNCEFWSEGDLGTIQELTLNLGGSVWIKFDKDNDWKVVKQGEFEPLKENLGHRELDIKLKNSPYSMATITEGEHAGRDVQVQLEFADGFCIVDIGHPLIIHRVCLRFWVPIKKFVVQNGQVWVDVLNEA